MADPARSVAAQHALRQRFFATWAALGATVHLCLPALHQATTPLGHVALWLWLLPTAAWALGQLFPSPDQGVAVATASIGARPRPRAAVTRGSRRPRRPVVAPPARRAG